MVLERFEEKIGLIVQRIVIDNFHAKAVKRDFTAKKLFVRGAVMNFVERSYINVGLGIPENTFFSNSNGKKSIQKAVKKVQII